MERFVMTLCALSLACDAQPAVGEHRDELAVREHLDRAEEPQILGASADRRLVVYGVGCGREEPGQIRMVDAWTGEITVLGPVTFCMPGSVRFSGDGQVVAFSDGEGILRAYSRLSGRNVQISRDRGFGLDFSPDSRWLVVANQPTEGSFGAALDAWDADLSSHVTISESAFYSPFAAPPFQNIRFSPDGERLLLIDNLGPGFPIGALAIWDHRTATRRQLATGVLPTAYAPSDDWRRIAWQRGVVFVPGEPPQTWQHGPIEIYDLATGAVEPVEADVSGGPVAFTRRGATLIYQVATSFGPPTPTIELRAHVLGGSNQTLDGGIVPVFGGAAASVVVHASGRVAYISNFDPQTFSGDLRLLSAPGPRTAGTAPVTIAHHTMPQTFGFVDGDALAYLHDPESTFPGAALGTLSARDLLSGTTQLLGRHVTQINLHPDPANATLLFEADYDMGLAAGTLSSWNSRTRYVKAILRNAAVVNFQASPDGQRVAAIVVSRDPTGENPPSVSLAVGWIRGLLPASLVAPEVRSFALGDLGRVVYATPTGIDAAWVF